MVNNKRTFDNMDNPDKATSPFMPMFETFRAVRLPGRNHERIKIC